MDIRSKGRGKIQKKEGPVDMTQLAFADPKVKKEYERILKSKEDAQLVKFLQRAFDDIRADPKCGISIPKNLIPPDYYKKYNIDNLWKYNLPGAWRLMYSLKAETVEIIAIILEWCDHKSYERRFGY